MLAGIVEDMEILENEAYHKRLLMYKGFQKPESLLDPADLTDLDLETQGYGVANWYLYNGGREAGPGALREDPRGLLLAGVRPHRRGKGPEAALELSTTRLA